jgi:hypothetical protein
MTFAEVIAGLIKALLSVSVLGVIGKLGFPHSWLFRSHRHEEAQPSDGSVGTRFDQAVAWNKLSSLSLGDSRFGKFGIKSAPVRQALSFSPEKIVQARVSRALEARLLSAFEALALVEEQTKTQPPLTAIESHVVTNWEDFRSRVIAGEHRQERRNTKTARGAEELPQKDVLGATKLDEKSSFVSLKSIQASKAAIRPVEA